MADVDLSALLEQIKQNAKAAIERQIEISNADLVIKYKVTWDNWLGPIQAGRAPKTQPPEPPKAYELVMQANGWPDFQQGSTLVCPMPALPADFFDDPDAIVTAVGVNLNNGYYSCLPADTRPAGYQVTLPDGTKLQKIVGPWYKYYKVVPS